MNTKTVIVISAVILVAVIAVSPMLAENGDGRETIESDIAMLDAKTSGIEDLEGGTPNTAGVLTVVAIIAALVVLERWMSKRAINL